MLEKRTAFRAVDGAVENSGPWRREFHLGADAASGNDWWTPKSSQGQVRGEGFRIGFIKSQNVSHVSKHGAHSLATSWQERIRTKLFGGMLHGFHHHAHAHRSGRSKPFEKPGMIII